jgi:hypothetical protein
MEAGWSRGSIPQHEVRGVGELQQQENGTAPHRASSIESEGSSVPQVSQQVQLGVESMLKMKEEIQEKRLETQRAHQVVMKGLWEAHRLEMKEMQKAFQLEMKEMRGAPQPKEEEMPDTRQPQARTQRHLGDVWKPGYDGPILARVGGANFPVDGGGTAANRDVSPVTHLLTMFIILPSSNEC